MLQEIRHAFRLLARNPGFTLIAALSLALGIGANSAIFSLADTLLLRPLNVLEPSRMVTISTDRPEDGAGLGGVSYPDYQDFRDHAKSFDGIVGFDYARLSLAKSAADTPQMRFGELVSSNYFQTLGVQPALGRAFANDEGTVAGRDPLVILSYDFWRTEFSADPNMLGRTLRINGIDFTVVGVAPRDFHSTDAYVRPYFYVPLSMEQRLQGLPRDPLADRSAHALELKGRLKDGVTREAAQAELASIWKGLEPEQTEADRHRVPHVRTELQARIVSDPSDAFLVALLMALTGVVLLIACANVANLLLGRARSRTREVAIRIALGVSRSRLARQLLTESMLLALLGVVLGMGFAYGGIRYLQTIRVPTDVPVVIAPQLDLRVMAFALLLGVVSAIVFGLAPALGASRTSLVPALKNAEAQTTRQRMLGRNGLVILQVALAMVLLVATGMLLDGFRKALVLDPGFQTAHILNSEFDTSLVRYTPQQTHDFYRELRARAAALPGVKAVALGTYVPLSPQQSMEGVTPEGYAFPQGQVSANTLFTAVDENYFTLMHTRIVRGRAFAANDKDGMPLVAIVNQAFADRYWPNQSALGKRLRINSKADKWIEVVGVAATGKYTYVGEPPTPFLYLPFAQNESTHAVLFTQAFGDPAALAGPLRNVVHSLDANQPIFNLRTFTNFYEQRSSVIAMIMEIVGTMGMVGLSLALIGLYGLVAYSVARRTREIGVRMAIGASRSDVLRMVLRQGLTLSVIGIVIGGAISVFAARALEAGLIGLGKANAATYVAVPVLLLAVTLGASYLPARRASRVDPMAALRYE
ncbi:MAG: ABC transporter permease [Acidobacteria bacterium]|nr:ABC transporter permease [Acidobacteriota bacterium]